MTMLSRRFFLRAVLACALLGAAHGSDQRTGERVEAAAPVVAESESSVGQERSLPAGPTERLRPPAPLDSASDGVTASLGSEPRPDGGVDQYEKVVGRAAGSPDAAAFMLDLAATKLGAGDVATAVGLFASHRALFSGTAEGRAQAARRAVDLGRDVRARACAFLAARLVATRAGGEELLQIAALLEAPAGAPAERRAAMALLELFLAHHEAAPGAARAWLRLGRLRETEGQMAHALGHFRVAAHLAPASVDAAEAVARVGSALAARAPPLARMPRVFVVNGTLGNAEVGEALLRLHTALRAAGLDAVFVESRAPPRRGEAPPPPAAGRVRALAPEALAAGDVVVAPGSEPPPGEWHRGAREREALVVLWFFARGELRGAEGAHAGVWGAGGAWSAASLARVLEGAAAPPPHEAGADRFFYRASASHAVLLSVSAPFGGLVAPPLPSVGGDACAPQVGDAPPHCLGQGARMHKTDLLLCEGDETACVRVLHAATAAPLRAAGAAPPDEAGDAAAASFCAVPLATVTRVWPDSPAAQAGLVSGAVVLGLGSALGGSSRLDLYLEVESKLGGSLPLLFLRPEGGVPVEASLVPRPWGGEGLLGCTLDMPEAPELPELPACVRGADKTKQRPLLVRYLAAGLAREPREALLAAAKVLLALPHGGGPAEGGGRRRHAEGVRFDVSVLVAASDHALLDLPVPEALVVSPQAPRRARAARAAAAVRDFEALAADRAVLARHARGLPAQFAGAAAALVGSARLLLHTVALDAAAEDAACTWLLSARLAALELHVRDLPRFRRQRADLLALLQARGLWNGVWLAQLPAEVEALDAAAEARAGTEADGAASAVRVQQMLAARPLSLASARAGSFAAACLTEPDFVFAHSPAALHALTQRNWTAGGGVVVTAVRTGLLLCYSPPAWLERLQRSTVSSPGEAEPASLYLSRALAALGGVTVDAAALSALGGCIDHTAVAGGAPGGAAWAEALGDAAHGALERMMAHPAWAAAEPFLSPARRRVFRQTAAALSPDASEAEQRCAQSDVLPAQEGGAGALPPGAELEAAPACQVPAGSGSEPDSELRAQIARLQRELSETRRMRDGWQAIAVASEKELANLRGLDAGWGGEAGRMESAEGASGKCATELSAGEVAGSSGGQNKRKMNIDMSGLFRSRDAESGGSADARPEDMESWGSQSPAEFPEAPSAPVQGAMSARVEASRAQVLPAGDGASREGGHATVTVLSAQIAQADDSRLQSAGASGPGRDPAGLGLGPRPGPRFADSPNHERGDQHGATEAHREESRTRAPGGAQGEAEADFVARAVARMAAEDAGDPFMFFAAGRALSASAPSASASSAQVEERGAPPAAAQSFEPSPPDSVETQSPSHTRGASERGGGRPGEAPLGGGGSDPSLDPVTSPASGGALPSEMHAAMHEAAARAEALRRGRAALTRFSKEGAARQEREELRRAAKRGGTHPALARATSGDLDRTGDEPRHGRPPRRRAQSRSAGRPGPAGALQDSQQACGVGMGLQPVDGGRWRVSKTVERGPADAAGVKPGAQLSRVGDKRVLGLTAADIAALVRGRPGSRVDMAFTQDDGSEETRSVERACA